MASQIQNLLERTLGDGARSTNFQVEFHLGTDSILNSKSILIKSTALPTRTHQIIDFKYRGKSIPLRGQTKYSQTWECTFYITEQHDVRIALEGIMDSLDNMTDYKTNNSKTLSSYDNTVFIFQTDHNDETSVMYTLYNVFPIEIGAITYDSSQVGVIAEMSVTFAYSYYEVDDFTGNKSENEIDEFVNKYTKRLNDFKIGDLYGKEGLIATGKERLIAAVPKVKKWFSDDITHENTHTGYDDTKCGDYDEYLCVNSNKP